MSKPGARKREIPEYDNKNNQPNHLHTENFRPIRQMKKTRARRYLPLGAKINRWYRPAPQTTHSLSTACPSPLKPRRPPATHFHRGEHCRCNLIEMEARGI
ncbi:MAG: hypothetical protein QM718_12585 [Steroidobacteraceae bacterium]